MSIVSRRILFTLALVLFILPSCSRTTAQRGANVLTDEEKREGWKLLFDGATTQGWRGAYMDSFPAKGWEVRDGMLRADLPDVKQAHSFLFAGDSTWTDYAVDFDVCGMRGVDKGVVVRVSRRHGLGVDLRGAEHQDVLLFVNEFPAGSSKVENANGSWHHVRVAIRGSACRVTVDNRVVVDRHLLIKPPRRGGIALAAYAGGVGQCTVYYDNVVVMPLTAGGDP